MNPPRVITLSQEHMDQMTTHVSREYPLEACGLIGGKKGRSLEVFPANNLLQSPIRFQIDPKIQLHVFNILDDRKWDLLAIYHSHPNGPEMPSNTDISESTYPDATNLIWSKQSSVWRCKAFIITATEYHQINIQVTDGM